MSFLFIIKMGHFFTVFEHVQKCFFIAQETRSVSLSQTFFRGFSDDTLIFKDNFAGNFFGNQFTKDALFLLFGELCF